MIPMTAKPFMHEAPEPLGVVYVVEDDEAVRDSLKWLLEASSYRVELFDSGEMFLAKFDPNPNCCVSFRRSYAGDERSRSSRTLDRP